MLFVNDAISIPDAEFNFTFARSGGPGGQNVNKVNSKAMLQWNVSRSGALPEEIRLRFLTAWSKRMTKEGCVMVSSQRYRDQGKNVADCLSRLREMILEVSVAPTARKASKPSRGAKQRRLSEKKVVSERKQGRRRPSAGD